MSVEFKTEGGWKPPSFLGIPLKIATQDQMRMAAMCGKFLVRTDDFVAYEYNGQIYVMPPAPPAVS